MPTASPDLSAVIQEVIDHPDWGSGSFVGLVIDPDLTPDGAWRCFGNFASGDLLDLLGACS